MDFMFFPHSISLFISYLYAYKRLHANKKMPDQGAVGSERATRQWNFTFYSLHFHSLHFNSLHLVTNRLCLHGTWRASSTVTFVFHYFSFWLGHRGMGLDMAWYGVVWRGMAVGSGCLFLFFFFFFFPFLCLCLCLCNSNSHRTWLCGFILFCDFVVMPVMPVRLRGRFRLTSKLPDTSHLHALAPHFTTTGEYVTGYYHVPCHSYRSN